jgi:hypothetical protein
MSYIGTDSATYLSRVVASSDDRDAWLTARNNGVTATNASKLASVDSIESILKSKFFDGFTGNPATEWGLEREPYLVQWAGFEQNKYLFHAESNPRFMATPDGIRYLEVAPDFELELCQVKTTGKPMKSIPAHYRRQIQWEMFVMGAARCYFVWEEHSNFVPTHLEPKLEIVERDNEAIASLVKLASVLLTQLDGAIAFEKEMQ